MFVVYKWKPNSTADIVGICFTKSGAVRAIRHYREEYFLRHPERECELGYEQVMPYSLVKMATFVFKI